VPPFDQAYEYVPLPPLTPLRVPVLVAVPPPEGRVRLVGDIVHAPIMPPVTGVVLPMVTEVVDPVLKSSHPTTLPPHA
jgi:hypothetical protein